MSFFAQIGLIAILISTTAILFLVWLIVICVKASNKYEKERQEDRELLRKPREIIVTIRNESETNNDDDLTFREKSQRR